MLSAVMNINPYLLAQSTVVERPLVDAMVRSVHFESGSSVVWTLTESYHRLQIWYVLLARLSLSI